MDISDEQLNEAAAKEEERQKDEHLKQGLARIDNFLLGLGQSSDSAVMLGAIRFDMLGAMGLPLDYPSTSPLALAALPQEQASGGEKAGVTVKGAALR